MPQITEIYLDKEDDLLDYSKRVIFGGGASKRGTNSSTNNADTLDDFEDLARCNSLQLDDEEENNEYDEDSYLSQLNRSTAWQSKLKKRYNIVIENNLKP
jgi:uncharacterized protein YgfB (UPF0149 family)